MGNILGESLSRIFEANGAKVVRCTYEGDVGLHIAKTIWGIENCEKIGEKFPLENEQLSAKMAFVGKCYAFGSNQYEDDEKIAEEIKAINKKVFEHSDEKIEGIYEKARNWSLEHFEEIYKVLGTKFDKYFFESEVAPDALKIVKANVGKVFEDSDGATVYKGETRGLHTRVFVNSQGLPTYEAKDIAHALRKFREVPADESIIITANEQDDYFRVVLSALSEISPEVAERTKHLSHGMLRLTDGKMSSRKGNVITGESLISETENGVAEIVKDRNLSEEIKKDIVEKVAVAAIKFTILRQAPGGDIIFDREKAISFEGDSGPYLQYTVVRCSSVLEKAGLEKSTLAPVETSQIYPVEHLLYRFPETVARAGFEKTPHHLVNYLLELSAGFNNFYAHNKILDSGEGEKYRLDIVRATKIIITEGLNLLGIKIPERM
jgi:arginyl-tRNA synthetase